MGLAVVGVVAGAAALAFWYDSSGARGTPIRVAYAGPVTGPSARDGVAGLRAVELIFEQVNAEGGIAGRPLALDVYDDQNQVELAVANAPVIADQAETVAVIGHNYSTLSIAAGRIYQERGIPAISSAATHVAVTRDNPWYFRTIFNDRAQGRFIVLYLKEVLALERVGLIHGSDAYGAYLAQVIDETAPELGLSLAGAWEFEPDGPQLDSRLDQIVAQVMGQVGLEALVLAMQPGPGVKLVKRLRDASFEGVILVSDALASQAFAEGFRDFPQERYRPGAYTDGIYASTPFLFDAVGKRAGVFLQDYLARYGEAPVWYSAFAADAAGALVEGLRRANLSPRADSIESDRQALRDALASIGPLDPLDGVTGPTWFDALGDAEKPVSMGRFLSGEIVSAFGQLRLLPGVTRADEIDERYDPNRVVTLGNRVFYRTDVARVGVLAGRFGALDFESGTFELDFNIWFRHQGDRDVEDVMFTNAAEPIVLGEPQEERIEGKDHYRRYSVRGLFRADTIDAGYGHHSLALNLHHRNRTRDDLVFAIDTVGMNLGRERSREDRIARGRKLLGHGGNWTLADLVFYETAVDEHAMGHPSYLSGPTSGRPFSQLTIGAIVRPQSNLRGLLPQAWQRGLLVVGLVGTFLLLVLRDHGSARLRWLLQTVFAFLVLLAAEPLLGDRLRAIAEPYQLNRVARVFDLLWWAVPAVLVNLAVTRFIWQPAEQKSGRPVPTLLRYTVAFVIYLLAVFGAIAFVYDYRLTGLLATSGMVAMIIGLAVQLNITNLFAGVALNLERPFRVGDWVMIHGRTPDPSDSVTGKVIDINWRTTRLQTADDTQIVIPNGIISEKTITNFMQPHEMSRFELFFTVDQSVALDRVVEVMKTALKSLCEGVEAPVISDPAPSVRIQKATENGVQYVVRYRILPSRISPNEARHRVNEAVVRGLRDAGIELAYPRRRVREEHAPPIE